MIKRILRILAGGDYDIFISYKRKEADHYSSNLASALTSKKFQCFFDLTVREEGQTEVPPKVIAAAKNSKMLVIVGTPSVDKSKYIGIEIESYLQRKTKNVVPIDFGDALNSHWYTSVKNFQLVPEEFTSLKSGEPSKIVLDTIENAFNIRKRNKQLQRNALLILCTFALVGILLSLFILDFTAFRVELSKGEERAINSIVTNQGNRRQEEALDLLLQNGEFILKHGLQPSSSMLRAVFSLESSINFSYPLAKTNSPVENLFLSSDENYLLSIHENGQVIKWDLRERKLSAIAIYESDLVDFSDSGNVLAFCENNHHDTTSTIKLVSAERLEIMDSLQLNFPVDYIVLLNDAPILIAAGDDKVMGITYKQRTQVLPLIHEGPIVKLKYCDSIALLISDKPLETKNDKKVIDLWKSDFSKKIQSIDYVAGSGIIDVLLTRDKEIFISSEDGSVRRLTAEQDTLIFMDSDNPVNKMFEDRNTRSIVLVSANKAFFWDNNKKHFAEKITTETPIRDLVWFADGGTFVTVGGSGGLGIEYLKSGKDQYFGEVKLWNTGDGGLIKNFQGQSEVITSLVTCSRTQEIIAGDYNGEIRIWKDNYSLSTHAVKIVNEYAYKFDLSENETMAAICDGAEGITLMDVTTLSAKYYFKEHQDFIEGVEFTPDQTKLISWDRDGLLVIWDLIKGKCLSKTQTHKVTGVSFSPDGKTFATGGWDDEVIRFWDLSDGLPLDTIGGFSYAEHVGDNILLITKGQKIELFELDTKRPLWTTPIRTTNCWPVLSGSNSNFITLRDHRISILYSLKNGKVVNPLEHDDLVMFAAFSAQSDLIVTGGMDGTARIWSSEGVLKHVLVHGAWVNNASLSQDGKRLLTICNDGTASIWDTSTAERIAIFTESERPLVNGGFINNDAQIITLDVDGVVRLYSLDIKEIQTTLQRYQDEFKGNAHASFRENRKPVLLID